MIQTETADELKTHFIFNIYFSRKNLAFYETLWRNMMDSNNITWRMRIACRINKARKSKLRICNNRFFYSSTIFRRKRLNVRLHVKRLYCPTLTTHDTTPLGFMSHQKCNIAYGCDSIFLCLPKCKITSCLDGFVIETYKLLRKLC